jgi:hypothetical protein
MIVYTAADPTLLASLLDAPAASDREGRAQETAQPQQIVTSA